MNKKTFGVLLTMVVAVLSLFQVSLLAAVTRLVSNGVGVSASATDGVGTSVFVSANKVTQNGVAFVSLIVIETKIVGGITTFKCGLYRTADEVLSESGNETTLTLDLADAVLLFDCSPGGAGAPSGSLSLTFVPNKLGRSHFAGSSQSFFGNLVVIQHGTSEFHTADVTGSILGVDGKSARVGQYL